ncbi:hypothetical protein [Agromyces sp. Root81]|uniref:hypothetical protein n=1 Tax=Agromyces sp. Root81 TaxID=1736601 RepID=UPI0012F8DE3D|nr:hypothetical protein [Agromyces sp. Root81]
MPLEMFGSSIFGVAQERKVTYPTRMPVTTLTMPMRQQSRVLKSQSQSAIATNVLLFRAVDVDTTDVVPTSFDVTHGLSFPPPAHLCVGRRTGQMTQDWSHHDG